MDAHELTSSGKSKTVRKDGTIHDPSVLSAGLGTYTPFSGMVACSNCGTEKTEYEMLYESTSAAHYDSRSDNVISANKSQCWINITGSHAQFFAFAAKLLVSCLILHPLSFSSSIGELH
jgi:hypothetical protein